MPARSRLILRPEALELRALLSGDPVAVNDLFVVSEDTNLSIASPGVLLNDYGGQAALSAVLATNPQHGALTLEANGHFTYQPDANYFGADSFTYRTSDGTTQSNPATVQITVLPVADEPIAPAADVYFARQSTPLLALGTGTMLAETGFNDATGINATAAPNSPYSLGAPAPGQGSGEPGWLEPWQNTSNGAVISSDAPLEGDGSLELSGSNTQTGRRWQGVVGGEVTVSFRIKFDAGSAISVYLVDGTGGSINVNADVVGAAQINVGSEGNVYVVDGGDSKFSGLVYKPGTWHDVSFLIDQDAKTYRFMFDGQILETPDPLNFRGTPALVSAVNFQVPIGTLHIDGFQVHTGSALPGVLANDRSIDALPLTAELVSGVSHGQLALQPNGTFTYTPTPGFVGDDTFTYRTSDGAHLSDPVSVLIKVAAQPHAPVAGNDDYAVAANNPLQVTDVLLGLLHNDSDSDGDPLTAVLNAGPTHGQLALQADGTFTYTPNPGYAGPDSFTYRASDGALASALATVTIQVQDIPVVANDSYTVNQDTALTTHVSDSLELGLIRRWTFDETSGNVAHDVVGGNDGTLSGWAPTETRWVPGKIGGALAWVGNKDKVVTEIGDIEDQYTFTFWSYRTGLDILNPNIIAPVKAYTEINRSFGAGSVYAPSLPNLGQWEHYAVEIDRTAGQVTVFRNGVQVAEGASTFEFPFNGSPWVIGHSTNPGVDVDAWRGLLDDLRIYDRLLTTDEVRELAGRPVDPAPGVLQNDQSALGGPLSAVVVATAQHGTLELHPNGTFAYQPAAGYSGPDSFTYQAFSHGYGSAIATVSINVLPVAPNPVAVDDAYELKEGQTLTVAAPDNVENGLIHHWTFDETSGNVAHDSVSDNDATLFGYGPSDDPWVAGKKGGALAYVNANNAAISLHGDTFSQYTFSFWLERTGAIHNPRILAPIVVYGEAGQGVGAISVFAPTPPALGKWEHYAVEIDRIFNQVTVYRDGAKVAQGNAEYNDLSDTWIIGHHPMMGNTIDTWKGLIDDLRIYNRLLSPAEIKALGAEQIGVLGNDHDPQGDALQAQLVSNVSHGALDLHADGTFTYQPAAGFSGVDSFSYRVSDGALLSNVATVTLTVKSLLVPGDVNGDGKVDLSDFGALKANFGTGDSLAEGDLDGNGKVDLSDFGILKANFGSQGAVMRAATAVVAETRSAPTVGPAANDSYSSSAAWQVALDSLFARDEELAAWDLAE
ncbi:MAG: Ig-like domain-containing protein [Pirellulales bacterium]